MEYIYYCKKCRSFLSADNDNMAEKCPKCNVLTVPTHMTIDDWHKLSKSEKDDLKNTLDSNTDSEEKPNIRKKDNGVALALKCFASILYGLSAVAALILILDSGSGSISYTGLFALIGCILAGLLLHGFGEVIQLLEDIKNKL